MPVPLALVVKNGTNRFPGSGRPGPSSSTVTSTTPARGPPAHAHAAAGLQRRIHRVADEVDQELVELVAVGGDDDRRPVFDRHFEPRLQRGRPADPDTHLQRRQPRLRQAGELRVGGHETGQRLGAPFDDLKPRAQVLLPVGRPRGPLDQSSAGSRRWT